MPFSSIAGNATGLSPIFLMCGLFRLLKCCDPTVHVLGLSLKPEHVVEDATAAEL
jgi:hypothetical protein